MRIIYRISDSGYNKVKPDYITNENCLANAIKEFDDVIWSIIADNVSSDTNDMIQKYVTRDCILYTEKGNGAATFNLALDEALTYDDDEIIYFIENDYLHKPGSQKIIQEAFELGADFASLYDHPDKYVDGINPYVEGGGEITKVFLSKSCHWKLTNSTTMTFAAKVKTLKKYESILRKYTSTTHPDDFKMWVELREQKASLITPLPGYATHGETAFLSPLTDWSKKN
jgi:hypothetical protein